MECQFSLLTNGHLLSRSAAVNQVAELHALAARLLGEMCQRVPFDPAVHVVDSHDQHMCELAEDSMKGLADVDQFERDLDGFHDDILYFRLK
jgi:hypothetical protein